MLLCFTASPCGSSCRQLAKNCPTPSTNMMPPAESSLDSPKRSLLREKVGWQQFVCPLVHARHYSNCKAHITAFIWSSTLSKPAQHQHELIDNIVRGCLSYVYFLFTALATLKPQAGLVAPQAVPASQPAVTVSDWLLIPVNKIPIRNGHHNLLPYFTLTIFVSAFFISGCWWRTYGD